MAKVTYRVLGPDHPIFNEGVTISTHRNDDGINKARRIADKVHSSQTDKKGYPYVAHINDVARRVQEFGDEYIIVALLHDAIEDAVDHKDGKKFQEEIINEIKETYNREVVQAINVMTKSSGDDYFADYLPSVKNNKIAK
jgi:(p)ppGpp synthase/HD superfamily hydrolase